MVKVSLARPVSERKKSNPEKNKKKRIEPNHLFPISYTRKHVRGVRRRDPVTRQYNFRSEFEKKFWEDNKSKIPLEYEPFHVKFVITQHAKYTPDFVVKRNGKKAAPVIYETKGWFRPSDRKKMLAVKECNPGIDITLVFQADNKLTKISKSRYSDWCRKHGFNYCIGTDLSRIVKVK